MIMKPVDLRDVMRRWASGVAILTTGDRLQRHGMTVSSFNSISVEPPLVTATMANLTRTKQLVDRTGTFAINLLAAGQEGLSEIFAGHVSEQDDRFAGLKVDYPLNDIPVIADAVAWVLCRVVHTYPMPNSTLYIGKVLQALKTGDHPPLIYYDRSYHRIESEHEPK